MPYRYYLLNRPEPTTAPAGRTAQEVWYPYRAIPESDPRLGERTAYGWVEYAEPLAFHLIENSELLPADLLELVEYFLWRNLFNIREPGWYAEARAEWLAVSAEDLAANVERYDRVSLMVLIIKEKGGRADTLPAGAQAVMAVLSPR